MMQQLSRWCCLCITPPQGLLHHPSAHGSQLLHLSTFFATCSARNNKYVWPHNHGIMWLIILCKFYNIFPGIKWCTGMMQQLSRWCCLCITPPRRVVASSECTTLNHAVPGIILKLVTFNNMIDSSHASTFKRFFATCSWLPWTCFKANYINIRLEITSSYVWRHNHGIMWLICISY